MAKASRFPGIGRAALEVAALLAFILLCIAVVHRFHLKMANDLLYASAGESRILKGHGLRLGAMTVCAPGGIGPEGAELDFAKLLGDIRGRYGEDDIIRLSKSDNPICTIMGLCLLDWRRHGDYLLRFKDDGRLVHYRSGCTINRTMTIGEIITKIWQIDVYMQDHRIELLWLGRIIAHGDA